MNLLKKYFKNLGWLLLVVGITTFIGMTLFAIGFSMISTTSSVTLYLVLFLTIVFLISAGILTYIDF